MCRLILNVVQHESNPPICLTYGPYYAIVLQSDISAILESDEEVVHNYNLFDIQVL